MNCHSCGTPMKPETALRGINPNYWREVGFRCNDIKCDAHGIVWFRDDTPENVERLLSINKEYREKWFKRIGHNPKDS